MMSVLTIVLMMVFICACAVAAWFGRYTLKGGPQNLYNRPWFGDPSHYALLLRAAQNRYYEKKNAAVAICFISFALILLLQIIDR
jgi:hypothetical protein